MDRKITLSDHARRQLQRRGLTETMVLGTARSPEQVISVRPGREVRQSRVRMQPDDRDYVVRVFVDTDSDGDIVVTAYRSSKIDKYWRKS